TGHKMEVMHAQGVERQERARQLLDTANGNLRAVALDQEDQPDVHAADRGRLIVDRTQQPRQEVAAVDDLLFPLAPQSSVDRVGRAGNVLGVDMPADTECVEVAEPPLT